MSLRTLDPLDIADWDALLVRSGDPDFFHTSGWARVLSGTYGFKPLYVAGFRGDRLSLLMPLMEVRGFFGRRRAVCLPFTDHCAPFFSEKGDLEEAVRFALGLGTEGGWRSIEWRDADGLGSAVPASESFLGHDLDLRLTEEALWGRLREANRRNIKQAVREGVTVEFGRTAEALAGFCRLNGLTRKRHGLPPQPDAFFAALLEHILVPGLGDVVSAHRDGRLLAASMFFRFESQAVFKYGASDPAAHAWRPNNLIMWEAIRRYRELDVRTLSLGRTEPANEGLLRYKRAWGAKERPLSYFRYDLSEQAFMTKGPASRRSQASAKLLSHLPLGLLRAIGKLAYRYVG